MVGNKVGNKVENKEINTSLNINDDISIITNYLKDKNLSVNMNKIMIEIYKNPRVTGIQLKNLIGISETAIDNNIKKLKNLGYLNRIGTKKIGYWSIVGLNLEK